MKKLIMLPALMIMLCSLASAAEVIISVEGVVNDANTNEPVPVNTRVLIEIRFMNRVSVLESASALTFTTSNGFFSDEIIISNDLGPNEKHWLTITVGSGAGAQQVVSNHPFYPAGGQLSPVKYLEVNEIKINNYVNSYFLNGFAGIMACRMSNQDNKLITSNVSDIGTGNPEDIWFLGNVNAVGDAFVTSGVLTGSYACDNFGMVNKQCVGVIQFYIPRAESGRIDNQFHWAFNVVSCGVELPWNLWVGPEYDHTQQNYFVGACCMSSD